MKMDYVTDPHKRDLEYINFFRSFLIFLTKTFDSCFTYETSPIETSIQMERNVMISLTLLRNIHESIFSKSVLYPQSLQAKSTKQIFEDDQSSTIVSLLKQLMKEVEQYPFRNENYKIQCGNTLEQILKYYYSSSSSSHIIVESDVLERPWLSKNFTIMSGHQTTK